MIGLPTLQAIDRAQGARIWMASEATDMRCGFDRLAERVKTVIGENPQSGHLFVFRSRRGDRLKILVWDRDGFVLWYKRLEAGVFKLPRVEQGARIAGVTCQRAGDDPGRDRCFETEASAALPTCDREPRIKSPRKKRKKEKNCTIIAICVTKLVETRLNERADQRNFLEQLTRRQAGAAGDVARSVA
jgi:transposase